MKPAIVVVLLAASLGIVVLGKIIDPHGAVLLQQTTVAPAPVVENVTSEVQHITDDCPDVTDPMEHMRCELSGGQRYVSPAQSWHR